MSHTHNDLVLRAVRWLRGTQRCSVVFAELVTHARTIPDAIGWVRLGGGCHFVECKTSRSDFRRDRHKTGHRAGILPGSHRWYMTPPGLLRPDELPDGWGLLEVHARAVRVIVQATHQEKRSQREEMTYLLSAVRRHELGVEWTRPTARFKAYQR